MFPEIPRKVPARVSCRAILDVPEATARTVSRWLAAHRRAHDTRPHQRAATPWAQDMKLGCVVFLGLGEFFFP